VSEGSTAVENLFPADHQNPLDGKTSDRLIIGIECLESWQQHTIIMQKNIGHPQNNLCNVIFITFAD